MSTTPMITSLPRVLIEEILSRVPLKSMRQVRLTCKEWHKLSKTRSFSKMRICKEASAAREGEFQMIVMMENNLHLMSLIVDGDPYTEYTETKGTLNYCANEQVHMSQVLHFEGLLLCILKEKDDTTLVVCNPYCGQTRWIKPRYTHQGHNGRFTDSYMYALGYVYKKNKSCRSHKILRLFDARIDSDNRFLWYEIYDFDSGLWTTLDVPSHSFIMFYQRGVSVKGKTYFCATETNLQDELHNHLVCFDYTSERFGPLLPFPFKVGNHVYLTLSCVKEEKLAALLTHNEYNPYGLDIWITTTIKLQKVSWSKFLTLNMDPEYPISTSGFFMDEEMKVAMGFSEDWNHHTFSIVGEAGYCSTLLLGERNCWRRYVCSYVPSLVKIKKPARGERKGQSKLEKHRYDEKMSRLAALENEAKPQSAFGLDETTVYKQSVGGKRKQHSKSVRGGKRRRRDN